MAQRNMEMIAEKVDKGGYIPPEYQLTVIELDRIYDLFINGKQYEALTTAFNYGFAMGCRATRKGRTKKI